MLLFLWFIETKQCFSPSSHEKRAYTLEYASSFTISSLSTSTLSFLL
ncbi:hypothetical protein EBGED10_21840 [Bacillus sp. GeD10]|nr:hypothetical protein EBGED10_21840 [Bacillus sp. GeD10]